MCSQRIWKQPGPFVHGEMVWREVNGQCLGRFLTLECISWIGGLHGQSYGSSRREASKQFVLIGSNCGCPKIRIPGMQQHLSLTRVHEALISEKAGA